MPDRRNAAHDLVRRRKLGQVFTPRPVADWMAQWACVTRPTHILDPAVGLGVFVAAVESLCGRQRWPTPPRVDACDIDGGLLRQFADTHGSSRLPIRRRRADFITAPFRGGYDAVIANPPYVRHRDLRYGEEVLASFDRLCRRRLSRMTNLYGLFLIKIWTLLAPRGRAAVITPAEWLNADFGAAIKAYLLEENAIDAIVHFDHAASVFDGALTTAAITLLRRGRVPDEPVRLCSVSSIEALRATDLADGRPIAAADLDPRAKWTPLFHSKSHGLQAMRSTGVSHGLQAVRSSAKGDDLDPGGPRLRAAHVGKESRRNSVNGRSAKRQAGGPAQPRNRSWCSCAAPKQQIRTEAPSQHAPLPHGRGSDRPLPRGRGSDRPLPDGRGSVETAHTRTLADIARCSRGIATGANDYFTLRESDRRRWGIDRRDLRICITKAQHLTDGVLRPADVRRLINEDRRIYLLCPRRPLSPAVRRYLAEGRLRGVDRRYLPAHRPVWYLPEHREPAPILVSVFARGEFRFVLNRARAVNLTAYHAIYPRDPAPAGVQALFDYLTSPAARRALRLHTRIYADGLSKLEPRDVEALPIPEGLQ
jgi:hypothetical protein